MNLVLFSNDLAMDKLTLEPRLPFLMRTFSVDLTMHLLMNCE